MQRVSIVSLISAFLLSKSKKRYFFKFIDSVEQETVRKKAQQKINTNKKVRM